LHVHPEPDLKTSATLCGTNPPARKHCQQSLRKAHIFCAGKQVTLKVTSTDRQLHHPNRQDGGRDPAISSL
jgi:hypothetical protein